MQFHWRRKRGEHPPQTNKTHKATRKNQQKETNDKETTKQKSVEWEHHNTHGEKWCDQATFVPRTEQAIRWKQQEDNQKTSPDGPTGAKAKKSQCRNPGSPQPGSRRSHCEAVQAWQAPMHIDHVDMPGEWKRGGETTVRHTEWKRKSLNPPASQSPLMCALAITIKSSHGELRANGDGCALVQWGMSLSAADARHEIKLLGWLNIGVSWGRKFPPCHCGCYFPPTQYVLPVQVKIEKPTTGTLPWRFEHVSVIWLGWPTRGTLPRRRGHIGLVEYPLENWAICNPLVYEGQFGQRSRQLLWHEVTWAAVSGSPLIWSVSFDFRQLACAISCINCNCCVVTVRSITLARASTLTCSLLRQLFAAWRVLLSWSLINPSRSTFCCIRLRTSSRCCWVSCSFFEYARSNRRSRASFLPGWVGACDCSGIALLALPRCWGESKKVHWEKTATGPWLDVLWHHPTLHCAMN